MFCGQEKDGVIVKNKMCGILLAILCIALIAWVGLKARNAAREYNYIGSTPQRNTITVTGEGKVVAIPDVAVISFGTSIERPTVVLAQQDNTKIMNAVTAKTKDLGVDSKDIQTTNYSIYPVYPPPDNTNTRPAIRGYNVSQNVTVKIRKLATIGAIISAVGTLGVNQVSGISFVVDDIESYRAKARVQALQNARAKADTLAKVVGITLRRVVSFSEGGSATLGPTPYYNMGLGYGKVAAESAIPNLEQGSNDIIVTADVTYEIN